MVTESSIYLDIFPFHSSLFGSHRCRAESAHLRESKPDCGLGFMWEPLERLLFPLRSAYPPPFSPFHKGSKRRAGAFQRCVVGFLNRSPARNALTLRLAPERPSRTPKAFPLLPFLPPCLPPSPPPPLLLSLPSSFPLFLPPSLPPPLCPTTHTHPECRKQDAAGGRRRRP